MLKKRQNPLVEIDEPAKRTKTIDFLQLTSDPTSLAAFLKRIEADEEDDLIRQYLSEHNGDELIALLESGFDRKSNELTVILKVLAIIIVRTNRDLASEFAATGRHIAEGILEEVQLAACFRALRVNNSAEGAKATLQLLASVVSTSPILGRSLLRSINFDHADWVHCARRRNTKDDADVRTCFINFVASFFIANNNLLIRELLESKNVIQLLISECFTDKLHNVLLLLTLLRTKIVENPTVSKTIKMRIFSRGSLKQLAYLYAYRGEALTTKVALSRSDAEIDAQAVSLVRGEVHKLLHSLTSSTVQGIVFNERASIDGSKQNEHLLYLLLSPPLENAFTDELRSELVIDCIVACPGLFVAYLTHWAPSMEPRDSENWQQLMRFMLHIFSLLQQRLTMRASRLLELSEDKAHFVRAIADLCIAPSCIVEQLRLAAEHTASDVVLMSSNIHSLLRENLKICLTWLNTSEELGAKGVTADVITEELIKLLPERILNEKWFKRFSKVLRKKHTDISLLVSQITTKPDVEEIEKSDGEMLIDGDEIKQLTEEEEINTFPHSMQKTLLDLLAFSKNTSIELSEKQIAKLDNLWPHMLSELLEKFTNKPIIYSCLSAGIRALSKQGNWASKKSKLESSPKGILRKISTESVFASVLLSKTVIHQTESDEKCLTGLSDSTIAQLKNCFVDLLLALAEVSPDQMAKNIPLLCLLAAYQGGLGICDRRLLQILFLLDSNGNYISGIWGMSRGVMWGDRLADHYRFGSSLGVIPTLWRQPNTSAFLNLLEKDKMLKSSLDFPVNRRCLAQSMTIKDFLIVQTDVYDPCFLLPLFLRYLSPAEGEGEEGGNRNVDLRGFYGRNCLCFAVAALSSYSRHLRGLAKAIIGRYRQISEAWTPNKVRGVPAGVAVMKQFPERVQINFILDTIRNSLSDKSKALGGGPRCAYLFGSKADTSFRLSRVAANFFIHSLLMLTKPEHRMYEVFWNSLLAKPAIDLGAVPDFIRIIFSVHENFRVERQWMVKLCADSVNDTSDYLLLEKSRVYKYCLLMYSDPGTDSTTQVQILRLLTATTKIPRACHALTRFHAFPLWLFRHALTTKHVPFLCYFLTIIGQMLTAFSDALEESPCLASLKLLDATFRKTHDESTFTKRRIKIISTAIN